jgi:FSR family fosmidomycin resistance protein-like MFS transporter
LLEFSNLMLDILYGYIALYFVDVVGINAAQASLAVTAWTGIGLLGDFLLIPLLERVRGLDYLRISAMVELVLFPAFLLVPGLAPKIVILALLGFFNAGWYSVLQGQLYSAMPGQSGTVLAVNNVGGFFGQLLPFAIALLADHFGLGVAIWLCLLGPIALLVGLPRRAKP